jgi:hypothetical protein
MISPGPDSETLRQWLEEVEENYQSRVERTVCIIAGFSLALTDQIQGALRKWHDYQPRRRSEELAEVRRNRRAA